MIHRLEAAWPLPYTSKRKEGNTLIIMPDQITQASINQMAMLTESFSQPEATTIIWSKHQCD
ncbi:hypothetical protein ACEQPO_03280 [Bacillus sp. SL00103]